jgi:tellurite methyltransferase
MSSKAEKRIEIEAEFLEYNPENVSLLVKEVLKYKQSGTLLDVGAGSGSQSIFLARSGFEVTAMDENSRQLEEIERAAQSEGIAVHTQLGSLEQFNLEAVFDVIVATMVLHYVRAELLPEVIARLKDATITDGIHVISVLTDKSSTKHPHLFKTGELVSYYSDWKVLVCREGIQSPIYEGGLTTKNYRSEIIVQKNLKN